jgi:hypothetical protein
MEEMLSAKRPFHKAGPQMFLDKIPARDWKDFITRHFRKRGRALGEQSLETLLASADLIPYDVQRIAHELWDYAELKDKRQLDVSDVKSVMETLVTRQSTYYELLWEQLSARQRAALQAIAHRGASEIYSQGVREESRLGPASSVQKALHSLDSRNVLDRVQGELFLPRPAISLLDQKEGHLGKRYATWHYAMEWASPGGTDSEPYGIATTKDGEVWYSESGVNPNTLVRFDPKSESFSTKPIPSGCGVVRNMVATPDRRLYLARSGVNKVAVVDLNK